MIRKVKAALLVFSVLAAFPEIAKADSSGRSSRNSCSLPYFQLGNGYAVSVNRNRLSESDAVGLNFSGGCRLTPKVSMEGEYADYTGNGPALGLLIFKLDLAGGPLYPYLTGGLGVVTHGIFGTGGATKAGFGLMIMNLKSRPKISLNLETSFVNGIGKVDRVSYINNALKFSIHF